MNIAASATSTAQAQANAHVAGVPTTLFFNSNALQRVLQNVGPQNVFTANDAGIQRVLPPFSYPRTTTIFPLIRRNLLVVEGSEGPFAFPIIEPDLEDYQGICTLLVNRSVIAAMLMVDFCNPIYSARRECLMQYVPDAARFNSTTKTYNVLENFTANVRASSACADTNSSMTKLCSYSPHAMTGVNEYLAQASNPFATNTQAAVEDYMVLVEGRRLLFKGTENEKPVGGLNEFELTLSLAVMPDPFPITKITKTGEVEVMPAEEIKGFAERAKARGYIGGCPMHCSGDIELIYPVRYLTTRY